MPTHSEALPGASDLATIRQDENHTVLSYGNLLIVLWRGNPEPSACRGLYQTAVAVAKSREPSMVSAVSVLAPDSAPSKEAREALERLHHDPYGVVYRTAIVLRRAGFVAAAVRSVVLAFTNGSGRRNNHAVFQDLGEALRWAIDGLPTAGGSPVSVPSLLRQLDRLQA